MWQQKTAPKQRKRKVTEGPKVETRWIQPGPNLQQLARDLAYIPPDKKLGDYFIGVDTGQQSSKSYVALYQQQMMAPQYLVDAPRVNEKIAALSQLANTQITKELEERMWAYCMGDLTMSTNVDTPRSLSLSDLRAAMLILDGKPGRVWRPSTRMATNYGPCTIPRYGAAQELHFTSPRERSISLANGESLGS